MHRDAPGDEPADRFGESPRADGGRVARPETEAAGGRPAEGRRTSPACRLEDSCPVTAAIGDAALGRIAHVGPSLERRFGVERRCRPAEGSGRVTVRSFRRPEAAPDGFADALLEQLDRWASLSDVDGVVPVLDRGTTDRPWVTIPALGPAVGGHEPPTLARALDEVLRVADALAALHDRGVVHAGIDPGNVVCALGADGRPEPALHNPGLVDVYRRYEDPAAVLDPRYAAPEYFAEGTSLVDRATDVYGLGAVTYRLVTGVPPVSGSPAAIADRVTADESLPRPSRLEPGLPTAIDGVLHRATATEKFDRFDTVRDLRDALVRVRDDHA